MPSMILNIELLSERTFTELFKEFSPIVYTQVMRMTRSEWDAEEIVQEVFMRVWIRRQKINEIVDMKAWLYIITRRIVFDYVVRLSKERNFLSTYKRHAPTNNEDALIPIKCRQLLTEAEQQLSPRQKQIYYMKHVKRLHQKEIASILNISEFTAMHHIKKSASIVKNHVMGRLEMEERKRA